MSDELSVSSDMTPKLGGSHLAAILGRELSETQTSVVLFLSRTGSSSALLEREGQCGKKVCKQQQLLLQNNGDSISGGCFCCSCLSLPASSPFITFSIDSLPSLSCFSLLSAYVYQLPTLNTVTRLTAFLPTSDLFLRFAITCIRFTLILKSCDVFLVT